MVYQWSLIISNQVVTSTPLRDHCGLREDGLLAAFIILLLLTAIASLAIAKCCTSAGGKRTKMN